MLIFQHLLFYDGFRAKFCYKMTAEIIIPKDSFSKIWRWIPVIGRFEVFTLGLSEISASWNKIAADELKPYGLKGGYIVYLIALFKSVDGLTSANLSEMCNRDKAEVSRAIKSLEGKGFIKRENVTVNSYRAKITLTEEGSKITRELRERIKLAVEKGGEGLSEEERESFYTALEKISLNLKQISKEGLNK